MFFTNVGISIVCETARFCCCCYYTYIYAIIFVCCTWTCQRLSNGIFLRLVKKNQDIKHDVVIIFRIVVVCAYFWSFPPPFRFPATWNMLTSSINDDKLVDDSKKKHTSHMIYQLFTSFSNSHIRRQKKIARLWVAYTYDTHVWIRWNCP